MATSLGPMSRAIEVFRYWIYDILEKLIMGMAWVGNLSARLTSFGLEGVMEIKGVRSFDYFCSLVAWPVNIKIVNIQA